VYWSLKNRERFLVAVKPVRVVKGSCWDYRFADQNRAAPRKNPAPHDWRAGFFCGQGLIKAYRFRILHQ
jgi:hypothetical protein